MPYDDPSPDDPEMLVGVLLPGGPESTRAMAEAFADEFARMGHRSWQILGLFQNPFYAGAHRALRALGEDAVREIVEDAVHRWPSVRIIDGPPPGQGDGAARPEAGAGGSRSATSAQARTQPAHVAPSASSRARGSAGATPPPPPSKHKEP
jgi:hypothetical protein